MGAVSELMEADGSLKVFPSLYVFLAFILLTLLSSFLLINSSCKGHQLPFIHTLLQAQSPLYCITYHFVSAWLTLLLYSSGNRFLQNIGTKFSSYMSRP
jgi:hypothetical protein